jgi:hypothetical protein
MYDGVLDSYLKEQEGI